MLTILGKPEQLKHGDLRLRLLCLFLCAHLVNVILVSFHGFKAFMLYKLTSDIKVLNYAYHMLDHLVAMSVVKLIWC